MADVLAIGNGLDKIEAEMRKLGMWDIEEPTPEAYAKMGAFGMNTMAFAQWLRWVFVPRVRGLLESDGPWPPSSAVGTHAVREFDGYSEASELVTLLCRFDDLF
jgi:uncharacterized protein YqcC (DUF446 family)